MKLVAQIAAILVLFGAVYCDDKYEVEIEEKALDGIKLDDIIDERFGTNLGVGLGVDLAENLLPYPTVPPSINNLFSRVFTPNKITGITPIYGLLKTITSNIYPAVSKTIFDSLRPLRNILDKLTSNIFTAFCAPPRPNVTIPTPGTSGEGSNPLSTSLAALGPLGIVIQSLIPGLGGIDNPLGPIVTSLGPLASLIPGIGGGIGTSGGGGGIGTSGGGGGGTANPLQPILDSLMPGGGGGSPSGNGGGSPSGNGGGSPSGNGGGSSSGGGNGGYPQVSGNVNFTLNLSPQAFNALLTTLGKDINDLYDALNKLGMSAQDFVDNYKTSGLTALEYLRKIFQDAADLPNVSPTGGSSGDGGTTGNNGDTLQGLLNNVLNILNGVLTPTGLTGTLNKLLTNLLGGLLGTNG